MKKRFLMLLIICIFASGCSAKNNVNEENTNQIQQKQQEIKEENISQVSCEELEQQTFFYESNKKLDYEERKQRINFYYDHCTRKNLDRWQSLGLEAIIIADQAETTAEKIKYLKISYENYLKSINDDGFMAASQAMGISKEYIKLKEYKTALMWAEKAIPYYEDSYEEKLISLPELLGDIYLGLGEDGSAYIQYTNALGNYNTELEKTDSITIKEHRNRVNRQLEMLENSKLINSP